MLAKKSTKKLRDMEFFVLWKKVGALEWNRTIDLGLRSPLLYPTELPGHKPLPKCAAILAVF